MADSHDPALRIDPNSVDYELRWPRAVFARELAALRVDADTAEQRDRIAFLLEEAFVGEAPMQTFRAEFSPDDHPWCLHGWYLERLAEHIPRLREQREPAPYWPARHARECPTAARTSAQHRFAMLITELYEHGYFGRALPPPCIDGHAEDSDPPAVLALRLGVPDLWPLRPQNWDEGTFFGLIEVFHDLAVRPRERHFHSYGGCGWHYSDFVVGTGQEVYRWRVNRLLESAGIELRLADGGEDTGRLVRLVDDARADLVERALAAPYTDMAERVTHAVALFRGRGATEHDKRSAAITLAGILEERRQLIRAEIGKKDEGALFGIANEFAIRHQRRDQHGDYDPAFLDWIFWWYLATIELTERILARQDSDKAS